MGSLISLIIIFILSILITKVASESLVHTGLSKEMAKFQARSAFTGVGFTTRESESIVNHPVRRKIIMSLMLIGNIGIISALASLMLTFVNISGDKIANIVRVSIIAGTLVSFWLLSKSKWLEQMLAKIIKKALKSFTALNIKDYVEILNLKNEYEITVITVNEDDWMASKKVKDIDLRNEGINLIGVQRKDGTYIGTPYGDTEITKDDQLILYGRKKNLKNLEKRKQDASGDRDHQEAIKEQDEEKEKQKAKDTKSK
ncbi:MAG: TrkA C-terminal domain-containing protein [Bacteroidetes bacterium]|nr:TrkA C-terminal domain-containing protein [Bacteroidota bacterium]